MQLIRNLCLGLAVFGGCVMEEDTVSEIDQDLYVATPDQLWSPYQNIPICFAYSSNDTIIPANQRLAVTSFVKERVMATWGSVLPFTFSWRDCPATGSNYEVLVDLSWHDTGGTCFTTGTGLLRTSDQRPGDIANAWGCHIGIAPDWNASPDRLLHTQQIIIHEFGHLLGFSHEFKRPDAPGAPCSGTDAPGGVTLGDYDPDSIMLATYTCAGNPGRAWLSAGDVAGAQQLYGARVPRYAVKDIAWQRTDGNVDIWRMDGTLRGSEYFVPTSIGSPYKLIGTGDFDGDGIGDLLYRQADGAVVIWLLNADGGIAAANLIPVPTDWVFQGIARFNNDNRSDVLWRNFNTGQLSTWMMDGVSIAYHREYPFSDWNWEIKLLGDFNGDGKADLFWRHRFGPVGVWLMNDGQPTYLGPTRDVDNTWTPTVAGDFDGDGKADVFWQNRDNRTSMWFMNATTINYYGSPGMTAPGWTAQIATDMDNDGKADLLWRRTDGSNGLWLMNGLSVRASLPLPTADTSWSMRGALSGAFDPVH